MKIIFDQYQRYKNTEIIINNIRKNKNLKILEVGANEHQNLEKFLPKDDISYLDIELSEEKQKNPKYILGDACNMSFSEGEFDIIVALDVFEHIPEINRESFIRELSRVSKEAFIISAPFNKPYVVEAEKRANMFFKAIHGIDHRWIKEHIDNKLPNLEKTIDLFEEIGINYEKISHGDIEIWERMVNINSKYIDDVGINAGLDIINEFYNDHMFYNDYSDNSYREFIIGYKNNLEISIKKYSVQKEKDLEKLIYLENMYRDTFSYRTNEINFEKNIEKNHKIQVYIDNGSGFSEEKSINIDINEDVINKKVIKNISINNKESIKRLRLDLINESSIIKIESIDLIYKKNKRYNCDFKFIKNYNKVSDVFIIDDNDPQMIIEENLEDLQSIYINYSIIATGIEISQFFNSELGKLLIDSKELETTRAEMNIMKKELEEIEEKYISSHRSKKILSEKFLDKCKIEEYHKSEIFKYRVQFDTIMNSTSWKITKPIRAIKDFFRKNKINNVIHNDGILKVERIAIEDIYYHVDDYKYDKENKKFTIKGWTFLENGREVKIKSKFEFKKTKILRSDVDRLFEGEHKSAIESGFILEFLEIESDEVVDVALQDEEKQIIKWEVKIPKLIKYQKSAKINNVKRLFNRYYFNVAYNHLKKNGVVETIKKANTVINKRLVDEEVYNEHEYYNNWIKLNEQYDKEKVRKEIEKFEYKPLISIVMPVYNVDEIWLRKCIDSVIKQQYENWELCIADDCSPKAHIKKVLDEYMEKEKRVKVVYRKENGHISKATNSALEIANGEFVGLLDNDDEMGKFALYEVVKFLNIHKDADFIYSDEDKITEDGVRYNPYFKPDWSPDTFLSSNYLCHFSVIRKKLVNEVGGYRVGYEGAQDYDLFLRVISSTKKIYHIPKILYHWRAIIGSTAMGTDHKNYAVVAGQKALEDYYDKNNIDAKVVIHDKYPYYMTEYSNNKELVSILIPTKDYAEDLEICLLSIYEKSTYENFEVIIIDNGSIKEETLNLFDNYKEKYENFIVVRHDIPFNYSTLNNEGAKIAKGEYLLLLNNDTEIITPNWIELMIGYARQEHVGAVGAKLFYPDDTIQHGGVIMGHRGVAGHLYAGSEKDEIGYFAKMQIANNVGGVTAACLMVSKKKFHEVGGLDESFKVAFNDVDFNLKLIKAGLFNVFLPQVELYHYESKSRGDDTTPEKLRRFESEIERMLNKWDYELKHDPCYNPNLDLHSANFRIDGKNKIEY